MSQQELGECIGFEVNLFHRLGGERDALGVILAACGVGEFRAAAVSGAGRPGPCAGEVEVLAAASGVAALIRARRGATGQSRLIWRTRVSCGHGRDQRKGFTEADYARLPDAARRRLAGPIVVIWAP